jgi:hypothetical protein
MRLLNVNTGLLLRADADVARAGVEVGGTALAHHRAL